MEINMLKVSGSRLRGVKQVHALSVSPEKEEAPATRVVRMHRVDVNAALALEKVGRRPIDHRWGMPSWAAMLMNEAFIDYEEIDVVKLQSALQETNLSTRLHAGGLRLRVAEPFSSETFMQAIIGRLANPDPDIFVNKYGEHTQEFISVLDHFLAHQGKNSATQLMNLQKQLGEEPIDYSGLIFPRFYFSYLAKMILRGADFTGAHFFPQIDLAGADLRGVKTFSATCLVGQYQVCDQGAQSGRRELRNFLRFKGAQIDL